MIRHEYALIAIFGLIVFALAAWAFYVVNFF